MQIITKINLFHWKSPFYFMSLRRSIWKILRILLKLIILLLEKDNMYFWLRIEFIQNISWSHLKCFVLRKFELSKFLAVWCRFQQLNPEPTRALIQPDFSEQLQSHVSWTCALQQHPSHLQSTLHLTVAHLQSKLQKIQTFRIDDKFFFFKFHVEKNRLPSQRQAMFCLWLKLNWFWKF